MAKKLVIDLERLKTKAGKKWLKKTRLLNHCVYLIGEGWFWREQRAGYTDVKSSAGIYTFADALDASFHCGAEKRIQYMFVDNDSLQPTQEPKGKAKLMLKLI